ncbi:MAG: lytic transglycosylase domain-containing protein [Flavobacteriales bacterium]|jgi:membrane-bound lytic murein transglycosylase D|nr:lytic transglycosylase domain-containing protein [Flavobacteriales bacterium]
MKKTAPLNIVLSLILIAFIFINATSDNTITYTGPKYTSDTYKIKAIKLPENLNFAGESIPIGKQDIKERMDRELLVNTYWQSNGLLLIKRASKYFPIIEPILKENGVPDDFKYLAVIESGLLNITSPKGAKGFWQLMKATAKENHLEVNSNVDERYNLELSTQVACDYLLKAKEKFGTWTLAAASYNNGISGIARKIEAQKVTSYYDLLVGDETGRYIPRLIAVKEILSHPEKYGFIFEASDLYYPTPTYTVMVDTPIHNIAMFAKGYKINYKTLKLYNPWLRENHLNNRSRKKYYIKLPNLN